MPRSFTYVFTGGGTGGHLFPGIAVAEQLLVRDPQARIVFAGSEREIEREIVMAHGYEHRIVPVEPSTRLWRNPVRFAWRAWRGCRRARQMFSQERPVAVVGLGGFASGPVVLIASSMDIPVVLLEQNVVPGRATRWLNGRASLVCLSFEETVQSLPPTARTCVTGNPVRVQIAELFSASPPSPQESSPTLLVLGGSQGAVAVNEAVLAAVETLKARFGGWRIVHQTGKRQVDQVRRRYTEWNLDAVVEPFFSDLTDWYRQADVVVSRAGATTLAELACAGCPAVLVPYPTAVGNHQVLNARAYVSAGAAGIVEQSDPETTAATLAKALAPLLVDRRLREKMRKGMQSLAQPRAARDVADRLFRYRSGLPV